LAYPSTFLDVQNSVIAKCRLQDDTDRSLVRDWINQAYIGAVQRTMEDIVLCHMTLTPGVHTYQLPAGIIEIRQMVLAPAGTSDPKYGPLVPISLEEILLKLAAYDGSGSARGLVTHYSLSGEDLLEVWPVPAAADVLWIYYLEQPTALLADTDVPRLQEPYATEILEYGASMKAAEYKGDQNAQLYRQLYEQAVGRLQAHLNRKKGATSGQFMLARPVRVISHDPSADIRSWSSR